MKKVVFGLFLSCYTTFLIRQSQLLGPTSCKKNLKPRDIFDAFAVARLKAAVSLGHYIFMTLCCLREKKLCFCLAVLPLTGDTAYSSRRLVAEPYFYVSLRYSAA